MEEWKISIEEQVAQHRSGVMFRFNGQPGTSDFGVSPMFKSEKLSALETAQLIRAAVNAYEQAVELKLGRIEPVG